MKRITGILLATVALIGCSYVGTAGATQGKVETFTLTCNNDFVQIQSIDKALSRAAINDQMAEWVGVKHAAKKGHAVIDFPIVMSHKEDGSSAAGYVVSMNEAANRVTLTPVTFTRGEGDGSMPNWTAAGQVENCHD